MPRNLDPAADGQHQWLLAQTLQSRQRRPDSVHVRLDYEYPDHFYELWLRESMRRY